MSDNTMLTCYVAVSLFVVALALTENRERIFNENIVDGVKTETHSVVTDDSYILCVFRMRCVTRDASRHKHSVLLVHGLGASSDLFTQLGPNLSLAYSLVAAGFDVWLANVRGNQYSRQHVYLDPDDPVEKMMFFNYTYENIGLHDIPATVDYVLNHTSSSKLHYIGHSQGGTAFLVLNSLRPEYSEKFVSAQLLAPAGYQKHFAHKRLIILSSQCDILYELLKSLGIVEWTHTIKESSNGTKEIDTCLEYSDYKPLCEILYEDDLQETRGGAIRQYVHFGQNINSRQFRRWDFGREMNSLVYETPQPPNYNLSLITVPSILHYGLGDLMVNYRDVLDMAWDMPDVELRMVPRADFGHGDFLNAPDAPELVYQYIIDTLLIFEGKKRKVTSTPMVNPKDPNRSISNVLNGTLLFIALMLKLL